MSSSAAALPRSPRAALWSLAFGNIVIGTGALAFVGMLDVIARDLHETHAAIGLVAGLFSLGICLSGPPLGALTSRFDRRSVLVWSLALFAVGHFAAAAAPGYWSLVVIRVATAFAGTLFTPQAAGTASLLVPAEHRGRAMSFVFLGWAVAAVLGMPAGAWFSDAFGWRSVMVGIGTLSATGALVVWLWIPARLFVGRIDRAAWAAVLAHPTMLRVVSVTAIHASAQFVLFSYLVVAYQESIGASVLLVTAMLSLTGLAGFVGNLIAGRIADRLGPPRLIHVCLLQMAVAFALWILVYQVSDYAVQLALTVLAAILWGAGNFSANSMQQVRLVNLAPPLAAVSVALNTSAIYLGQFVGAAIGGFVLSHALSSPPSEALPWVALPVFFIALWVSLSANRADRLPVPTPTAPSP